MSTNFVLPYSTQDQQNLFGYNQSTMDSGTGDIATDEDQNSWHTTINTPSYNTESTFNHFYTESSNSLSMPCQQQQCYQIKAEDDLLPVKYHTPFSNVNSWLTSSQAAASSSSDWTNRIDLTESFDGSENWEDLVSSLSPRSSTDSYLSCGSPPPAVTSNTFEPTSTHRCKAGSLKSTIMTTKWQRKKAFEMTLPLQERMKRRLAANARERKRMTNLNVAFERLREILPMDVADDNNAKPISKMEALQMAQAYIKELSSILEK